MAKFIKLTNTDESDIFINVEQIQTITKDENDPRHHIIILVHWTGIFLFCFSINKINTLRYLNITFLLF